MMYKTREFQTQLLHYFSKSDDKSNRHHKDSPSLVSVFRTRHLPADFGDRFFFGLFWWPAGKGRWSAVGKKWESRAVSVVKL